MQYILTKDSLTITLEGKPYAIPTSYPGFVNIRDAVLSGQVPSHILELIQRPAQQAKQLVAGILNHRKLTGTLTYDEGIIYFNGEPIKNYAVDTLLKFLQMGHDATALATFVEKQQQNPDPVVHEHLYAFLEVGNIPLCEDGDFLVYKAVRANYFDIHSGRFDNSVGRVLEVARPTVDPNRERTCSTGLHVCSFAYLPNFANADGHVMLCKVNPADVVAIPVDYNNTKMRVCRYEVVGEVTSYYQRGEDILAADRSASNNFEVWVEGDPDDIDSTPESTDSFYTRGEAISCADALKAASPDMDVWVEDPSGIIYDA